jgi:cytoskeletal protein RodZ
MTARHQLRIGNRRLGRDRAQIDSAPAPRIGETLQLARERKGVDLYRAERDTKIRLRYLSALEDGTYEDLPAPVYTKGFLRNYAIYLGLDPDEILERWRDEMESLRSVERVVVAPPPQPMAAPGRHLTLTPGMLVAGLVALVVVAFIGYLAIQLLRYVETTPVGLTNPPNRFSTIDADKILLEGTSGPGARITIRGPGDTPYSTDANQDGEWSREVALAPGRNDFTITANDAVTDRPSTPLALTINVPLPSQAPGASPVPSAAPPAALVLTLFGPTEGQVSTDGNLLVRGTTSGSRVTIDSTYLGAPLATTPPTSPPSAEPSAGASPSPTPRKTPKPTPTPTEAPLSTPTPGPTSSLPPIGPATSDITVAESGSFAVTLSFPIGRWELTITSHGIGVSPVVETRTITVSPPFASGLTLGISVQGSNSWVRLLADGVRVGGYGTLHVGDIRTATAVNEICLRAGNAGALHLTLNGLDIGLLGRAGQVGSWLIRPGQGPVPADVPC